MSESSKSKSLFWLGLSSHTVIRYITVHLDIMSLNCCENNLGSIKKSEQFDHQRKEKGEYNTRPGVSNSFLQRAT